MSAWTPYIDTFFETDEERDAALDAIDAWLAMFTPHTEPEEPTDG